jgi:glycosyltransferase involved in cell wall biosynthesis
MVTVSVIIPVFNTEAFLTHTIESVVGQRYNDWEIIAVDDGSTDRSATVLQKYVHRLPGKFHCICQENQGASSARNRAIGISSGQYIAFLDSDDAWFPEKLEIQVGILEDAPHVGMVYADCLVVNQIGNPVRDSYFNNSPPRGWIFQNLLLNNFIPTSSVVIRRSVLQEIGLFNLVYRISQDYDLWLRVSDRYQVAVIEKPLVQYRIHPAGISRNRVEMVHEDLDIMEEWLHQKPELREQLAAGIFHKRRISHYSLFLHHLHSHEFGKASRAFLSWLAMGLQQAPQGRSELQ